MRFRVRCTLDSRSGRRMRRGGYHHPYHCEIDRDHLVNQQQTSLSEIETEQNAHARHLTTLSYLTLLNMGLNFYQLFSL